MPHDRRAGGGDVALGGGNVRLRGDVGGGVQGQAEELEINGVVGGPVDVEVGSLALGPQAQVRGDVLYTSRNTLDTAPTAVVEGNVQQRTPSRTVWFLQVEDSFFMRALARVIGQLQWFLATLVIGLAVWWLTPFLVRANNDAVLGSPWQSLGLGLVIVLVYPVIAAIIGILAVILTGAGGLPLLAVPFTAWLSALLLSSVFISFVVGTWALERVQGRPPSALWALVVGAAVIAILGLVPFLGALVRLLVVLFGVGGLTLATYRLYRQARAASPVTTLSR